MSQSRDQEVLRKCLIALMEAEKKSVQRAAGALKDLDPYIGDPWLDQVYKALAFRRTNWRLRPNSILNWK